MKKNNTANSIRMDDLLAANGGRSCKCAFALALMVLAVLIVAPAAQALTPAGTKIYNQSVATFEYEFRTYKVSSNLVETNVSAVYGIDISPSGGALNPAHTARAVAGSPVNYRYTLTNTGNAVDSYSLGLPWLGAFSDFEPHIRKIYVDVDNDGRISNDA